MRYAKGFSFFKKEGEEGIALTSTSANHIANMAKEYIQGKAKNDLINGLQSVSLDDWCEEYGVEKPLSPVAPHVLTEQEYYASLPIKERNRYYQLEAVAAVIGKYIHPDGVLSDERKKLKDRIQHPHRVDGKGRDALIYTYEPSVSAEDVDNTFYELQKKHREVQARLNSI